MAERPAVEVRRFSSSAPRSFYADIAQLHVDEIHHGVLPLLGKPFLANLYRELAVAPRTGIWGVTEGGTVVAFIAGCADLRESIISVVRRAFFPLALSGLRSLFSIDVLSRIFGILTYFTQRPERASENAQAQKTSQRAELLAIAVSRRRQRRGIGKALIAAIEEGLRTWRVEGHYYVATNAADADSNAFYREMDFHPCAKIKHHRLTLQVYRKPVPSRTGWPW